MIDADSQCVEVIGVALRLAACGGDRTRLSVAWTPTRATRNSGASRFGEGGTALLRESAQVPEPPNPDAPMFSFG